MTDRQETSDTAHIDAKRLASTGDEQTSGFVAARAPMVSISESRLAEFYDEAFRAGVQSGRRIEKFITQLRSVNK